ncbi:hypothetical protein Ancab_035468 [Ancistrocladus abbreviatus]
MAQSATRTAAIHIPIDQRLRLRPPICDSSFRFFFLLSTTTTTKLITPPQNSRSRRKQSAVCSICCESKRTSSETEIHQQPPADHTHSWTSASCTSAITRRKATLQMAMVFTAATVPSAVPPPSLALDDVPDDFRVYSDDINKYRIVIPRDWQVGSGEGNGLKSVTAFYPEEASGTSNVSVVITGLGPDFTRLESFGKVDAFAENLVSGLDRSWQRPPGMAAKLIDSKAANGLYYIEYTLQNPGESRKHIYSAMAIGNNGWYNRLYTVTGQFLEEEAGKYSIQIEKVVQSFRLS